MKQPAPKREDLAEAVRRFADKLNVELEAASDRDGRAAKGQFTTPSEAAATIARLVDLRHGSSPYRVLDPGAGAGSLTLGLIAEAIEQGATRPLKIDLVENDPLAAPLLADAIEFARASAGSCGLEVDLNVVESDFIDAVTTLAASYDVVVMNPPYKKLGQADPTRKAVVRRTGVDCPNIYAAFVAAAVDLLTDDGQLVAITPRSFANGQYFTQFRHQLTRWTTLRHVVLFERRDRVFRSSTVLQETVIFRVDRRMPTHRDPVTVETRVDHVSEPHEVHEVEQSAIYREDDPERFINLPGTPEVMALAARVRSHPQTLSSAGLDVSTGPVVDFRARDFLTEPDDEAAVPLIYPANVRADGVSWPVEGSKAQGFLRTPDTQKLLYPNGCYVLVKRFTAKEEKRRVVAGVFDPIEGFDEVAFENHVNVIHRNKQPLSHEVAKFVADYLNSEDVDTYFRMFSGNTQVNATDLRRLHIPEFPIGLAIDGIPEPQGSLFGVGVAS